MLFLRDQPCPASILTRGVVTRSGKSTNPTGRYGNENSASDSEIFEFEGDDDHPDPVTNPEPRKSDKHVTFNPDQVSESETSDVVELLPRNTTRERGLSWT